MVKACGYCALKEYSDASFWQEGWINGWILTCFLECVDQTRNGNLPSKPSGAKMISKPSSWETSTFNIRYWNTPISLLIFSGAIVLTAQTIEAVQWIQESEKCVIHQRRKSYSSGDDLKQPTGFAVKSAQWLTAICTFQLLCMNVQRDSSPAHKHNECSVQMGNLSQLSGNKQWPVDNGSLVLLSSSYNYIKATGMLMACHSIVGVAAWSVKNVWRILVSVYLKLKGHAKQSLSTICHCMSIFPGFVY